jgi:hypothetical protein
MRLATPVSVLSLTLGLALSAGAQEPAVPADTARWTLTPITV